jgi:hypothetical protein
VITRRRESAVLSRFGRVTDKILRTLSTGDTSLLEAR